MSQTKKSLYYFIHEKDSLVGVKDNNGNIIIPAVYVNLQFQNHEKIPDDQVNIIIYKPEGKYGSAAISFGDAFDRNGNILYHPLVYDNGPDYISEGSIRCVENGKVGFVNREGIIIIKPQWDWVSPFNYGYSFVCNGCYFDYSKDPEHAALAFHSEHEQYYINKAGEKVDSLITGVDTLLDYNSLGHGYYPYPFRYNATEKKIVDSFNSTEVIRLIRKMQFNHSTPNNIPSIRFEITNKPTTAYPYYEVQGYRVSNNSQFLDDDLIFLVDKAGHWLIYDSYTDTIISFKKWLALKNK